MSALQMLPLIIVQALGKQKLARVPEPESITAHVDNVQQYDRVMETKLSISYAIAVEMIYRVRMKPLGGHGLDIASGPGHLTITMARELKLDSMYGVDLSAPMVETANGNARGQAMSQVRFQTGDATRLDFATAQFDLTTMMDAAHHMPSLDCVNRVLREMNRVTKPEGTVVVMDLVRLRTERLTEKYVNLLGNDYVERKLPNFFNDFRNSMYAAWTPGELSSAVPDTPDRKWSLVVPRGLPFAQFLIGTPPHQRPLYLRRGTPWSPSDVPVTTSNRADYRVARATMAGASLRGLRPHANTPAA